VILLLKVVIKFLHRRHTHYLIFMEMFYLHIYLKQSMPFIYVLITTIFFCHALHWKLSYQVGTYIFLTLSILTLVVLSFCSQSASQTYIIVIYMPNYMCIKQTFKQLLFRFMICYLLV